MRVLLDMDHVIADFDGKCFDWLTQSGIHFDITRRDQQVHHYLTDHIPNRSDRKIFRKWIDTTPGWFRDIPVVPGAQEGVRALQDAGHDIWVCTKPLEVNPTCRDDKAAWIREHFPELEEKLIIAPDKSIIHGDVLIDDGPRVEWFARATWKPVIFRQPYNGPGSKWDGLPRVHWDDIGHLLQTLDEIPGGNA